MPLPKTGIEPNYDDLNRNLVLYCEADSFAEYRAIARRQLADLPEIPVDEAISFEIVDVARHTSRRNSVSYQLNGLLFIAFALFGGLWGVTALVLGSITIFVWIGKLIS